jgi:hypothetical protein
MYEDEKRRGVILRIQWDYTQENEITALQKLTLQKLYTKYKADNQPGTLEDIRECIETTAHNIREYKTRKTRELIKEKMKKRTEKMEEQINRNI